MVEAEYLIDTNIFLEVLLDQENRGNRVKFLRMVESGKIRAVMTSFSLHSIAIILERLKGIEHYQDFLEVFVNFEGLMVYSTTPQDEIEICKISRKKKLSFDDALHYFIAKTFGLKIVSFDSGFDKTEITRVAPKDII